jgi:hypothetical protein
MTDSEWLDHWVQQAPALSGESLDNIHGILTTEEDE